MLVVEEKSLIDDEVIWSITKNNFEQALYIGSGRGRGCGGLQRGGQGNQGQNQQQNQQHCDGQSLANSQKLAQWPLHLPNSQPH